MAAFFQIMSDLHLENPASAYSIYTIPPRAPYLALLGDIGDSAKPGLTEFLLRQLPNFEIVFFLVGNHEPYHSSWAVVKAKMTAFEKGITQRRKNGAKIGRFVFLDQTRYDISSYVTVLGCTLYSNILDQQLETVSMGLNDFYHIDGGWDVHKHRRAHAADLQWLNEQVRSISQEDPKRKIIIMTHHSPVYGGLATNPRHAGSMLASGFATDLSTEQCWRNPSVKVWAFGHTHFNCDYRDEGTRKRVVTNQKGYYFAQAAGFDEEKVVQV
jgi:Calcineurin-like phosphoesterase